MSVVLMKYPFPKFYRLFCDCQAEFACHDDCVSDICTSKQISLHTLLCAKIFPILGCLRKQFDNTIAFTSTWQTLKLGCEPNKFAT